MQSLLQKLPFLLELFFNGSYIILYSLKTMTNILQDYPSQYVDWAIAIGANIVPFVILFVLLVNYTSSVRLDVFLRRHIFSLFVFFPLLIMWGDAHFTFLLAIPHLVSSVLIIFENDTEIEFGKAPEKPSFSISRLKPAQAVIITFVGISFVGALLLMLPLSKAEGTSGIGFVDAFFMASSATCVTGLTTVSLSKSFSFSGQLIMLMLIQVGGLGYMTLSSSLTILLGRSIAMREKLMLQDLLDLNSQENLTDMIIDIIKYTAVIELIGAIVLFIGFFFLEDFDFGTALYYGIFHSISAFCNAGFAMFDNSLVNFSTNPIINFTVMTLITLGGFGFIVLKELREIILGNRNWRRITVHSKIVLSVSLVLTLFSTCIIFFGEYLHALDPYSLWDKLQIALFQAVTLRTAGFNTIDLNSLHSYTLYMMTLFMFIGASPGSTGGGIKTTTLAILFYSIRATLRGEQDVIIYNRTIPSQVIVRVIALTFISIVIVTSFIFILMKVESQQSLISIMFEVVSASGTVGLSLGLTSFLSVVGKIAITVVMLIGRMGPLTLVLALGDKVQKRSGIEYPVGKVMIG